MAISIRLLKGIIVVLIFFSACSSDTNPLNIKESFLNPPDSVRAHTWWHWIDGNISKEGITKDPEASRDCVLN
ncbi:MAG: hypothetical protein IH594_09005 [Bacteroidales bacterium]|nr:hypothetical protein [Bacteroidales bacterium]